MIDLNGMPLVGKNYPPPAVLNGVEYPQVCASFMPDGFALALVNAISKTVVMNVINILEERGILPPVAEADAPAP